MKEFKQWPICEKHGVTYNPKRGCYSCRKEKCNCVASERIILNGICTNCNKPVVMKKLDEVLKELKIKV